jgi:hypothetical protein
VVGTLTSDLEFYCRELESITNLLMLAAQLTQANHQSSKINFGSLVRASHKLRDFSLIREGCLISSNGELMTNGQKSEATFAVVYTANLF